MRHSIAAMRRHGMQHALDSHAWTIAKFGSLSSPLQQCCWRHGMQHVHGGAAHKGATTLIKGGGATHKGGGAAHKGDGAAHKGGGAAHKGDIRIFERCGGAAAVRRRCGGSAAVRRRCGIPSERCGGNHRHPKHSPTTTDIQRRPPAATESRRQSPMFTNIRREPPPATGSHRQPPAVVTDTHRKPPTVTDDHRHAQTTADNHRQPPTATPKCKCNQGKTPGYFGNIEIVTLQGPSFCLDLFAVHSLGTKAQTMQAFLSGSLGKVGKGMCVKPRGHAMC
jgi:hypothetical protein